MKALLRYWWVFCLGAIVLGLVMLGTALMLGADGFYLDSDGLHTMTGDDMIEVSEQLTAFEAADLNSVSGDILMIPSDRYALEMRVPKGTEWQLEGGCLVVKSRRATFFNFFGWRGDNHYVRVYYPQDAALTRVKASSVSGEIQANLFQCPNVVISSTSGDINLTLGEGGAVKVSTVSGGVTITAQSCERLEISSTSGDMHLSVAQGQTTLKANTVSGQIRASGAAWQSPNISATSGDVSLGGAVRGNGKISTVSGDVVVSGAGDGLAYSFSSVSGGIRTDGYYSERRAKSPGFDTAENRLAIHTTSGDAQLHE